MLTAYVPAFLYAGGRLLSNMALVCAGDRVHDVIPATELDSGDGLSVIRLDNRALLPALVNAHSHSFQRVIRGRTEYRTRHATDTFWTWREMMYRAASRLTPSDIYVAARMAFLEMALTGIASVGEFHYIHRAPDGAAYDDANLLAKQVVRAARDVGLRIALLHVAYARAGYRKPVEPAQRRFIEPDPERYLREVEMLSTCLAASEPGLTWAGLAPHSIRAVPLPYLREIVAFASAREIPVHMHVAEQAADVAACAEEHGRTPVELLDREGLLSDRFTAVHAIHVTPAEIAALARARACVCACPSTERNLGDGIVPAGALFLEDVAVSLGSDSQAQIDLLEDARELEYHMRLQSGERAVLGPDTTGAEGHKMNALAARLFDAATRNGAASIRAPGATLAPGEAADFFTVDLDDPSVAGASSEDLIATVVFSLSRAAVREVFVGGKLIVDRGRHRDQDEIVAAFRMLQRRLWSDTSA